MDTANRNCKLRQVDDTFNEPVPAHKKYLPNHTVQEVSACYLLLLYTAILNLRQRRHAQRRAVREVFRRIKRAHGNVVRRACRQARHVVRGRRATHRRHIRTVAVNVVERHAYVVGGSRPRHARTRLRHIAARHVRRRAWRCAVERRDVDRRT